MRRIDYKLTIDGDPFTVASYNIDGTGDSAKTCLPIKMEVTRCTDDNGESNIVRAARLDRHCSEEFALHYPEILLGRSEEWKLTQFIADTDCLCLRYYGVATDDVEDITIPLCNSTITMLHLAFWVPHQDGRPATEYRVSMDCAEHESSLRTIVVKEMLSPREHSLFLFDPMRPNEVSVTQYVDL